MTTEENEKLKRGKDELAHELHKLHQVNENKVSELEDTQRTLNKTKAKVKTLNLEKTEVCLISNKRDSSLFVSEN